MSAIIHVNDNNLLVQQGETVSRSQGYSWLKNGEVYFDTDPQFKAVLNCRLEPQQINSRYWQQCQQIAIAPNDCGMRHAADLIWRHLSELKLAHKLEDVVLVVPSHYQAANLQLLLGIAKSCGLRVNGLINKAVLALQGQLERDGKFLHTDVQLHQTVCSEVVSSHGKVKLEDIEILHEVGLQMMQDSLLKAIQNRFISSDRFDPLHYAETEQQLFDQLPHLAKQLAREAKANVSVTHHGRQHATSIDNKQWNTAIEQYTQPLLAAGRNDDIDHHYFDFNGFQAALLTGKASTMLIESAPSQAVLKQVPEKAGSSLIYTTELALAARPQRRSPPDASAISIKSKGEVLPGRSLPVVPERPLANGVDPSATHLLQGGVAVPISQARIVTDNSLLRLTHANESNLAELLNTRRVFIMGDVERKQLKPDDRLGSDLGEGVITVINVVHGQHGDGI